MRASTPALVAMLLGLTAGCSLDRAGISAGGEGDSGIAPVDAAIDAFVPPGEDGGPPPIDAFVPPDDDGGPPPVDAGCASRCEGSTVVACSPDGTTRYDCAEAGATCSTSGPFASPVCGGGACSGGACSADGSEALQCPGGVPAPPLHCDRGCDAGACREPASCSIDDDGTMTTGTMRFDLCGAHNDSEQSTFWSETGRPCQYSADGEDRLVRLDVDRRGHYAIEVIDVIGDGLNVDPIVYVRARCTDTTTELGCNDDVSGTDYDSRLELDLDPGEYFVVVDSIDSSGGGTNCGQVDLSITRS